MSCERRRRGKKGQLLLLGRERGRRGGRRSIGDGVGYYVVVYRESGKKRVAADCITYIIYFISKFDFFFK